VTGLAVRSVDLDDLVLLSYEMPGQPRTPRAGALDSRRLDRPEPQCPNLELSVPRRGRRERLGAQQTALGVQHGGHIRVGVSVDTDRDTVVVICQGGYRHHFSLFTGVVRWWHAPAEAADKTVMGA
jgi:hypothetical protein